MAYGLAVNLPNIDAELDGGIPAIESATLVIVLVSTLLFGGITGVHNNDSSLNHWCYALLIVCMKSTALLCACISCLYACPEMLKAHRRSCVTPS